MFMNKTNLTRRRRTRVEPPTIEEAVAAAQGMTPDPDQQAQLAAELMGVSEADVRPIIQTAAQRSGDTAAQRSGDVVGNGILRRPVVVERKARRTIQQIGWRDR
jgi:hypothetical protein